jgi:methyl acetate hydrolase
VPEAELAVPEETSMEGSRLDALFEAAAREQRVPGLVAMATDRDGVLYEGAFGERELGGTAMTLDTVFLMASMTKAVTAVAAMQLVEQGRLELDAPAHRVLPALADVPVLDGYDGDRPRLRKAKRPMSLRHLLTHTAGHGYEFLDADVVRCQEQLGLPSIFAGKRATLDLPLLFDPGERWCYGTSLDVAGLLVEAVSGQRLGDYMREHILAPLGMKDTGFTMSEDARARLATIHARAPDGKLAPAPLVLDQDPEQHMGGHGLYGTAGDYLRFVRMLLNDGQLDGVRVLRPETVALMNENHIGELEVPAFQSIAPHLCHSGELFPGMVKKWGLSFLINTERTPQGRSANSLAWAGLANSYYWLDRHRGVGGVLFSQILPFFDPVVVPLMQAFEQEIYDQLG